MPPPKPPLGVASHVHEPQLSLAQSIVLRYFAQVKSRKDQTTARDETMLSQAIR